MLQSKTATKESFLRKLRIRLFWRMEAAEMTDILADYEEFFETGAAEGKSEAELCRQFGNPSAIARHMAEGKRRPVIVLRILLAGGLLTVLTLLCMPLMTSQPGMITYLPFSKALRIVTIYTAVLPAILWLLLGGSLRRSPRWAFHQIGKTNHLSWLSCLAVLLFDAAVFLTYLIPVDAMVQYPDSVGFQWFGIWMVPWYEIGRIYKVLGPICCLALLAGLFVCLYWFSCLYYRIFPCVCLLLGSLACLAQMHDILMRLDDPALLTSRILIATLPLLCGLLMAVISWGIIYWRGRRGLPKWRKTTAK